MANPCGSAKPSATAWEAGGKRVRPVPACWRRNPWGAERDGPDWRLALEYLHTYSLIHDDLPAMDDDDLRRGKPTCHVAFGEAHAILAGDGLRRGLRRPGIRRVHPAGARVEAIALLAEASGWRGMVGGQALDLEGEAVVPRSGASPDHSSPQDCALLRASLEMGAVLGALKPPSGRHCGVPDRAGLASKSRMTSWMPLSDDATLGKRAGKDAGKGKITYPGPS